MKTVIFKKTDGHNVIQGFSVPVIDPVETNKIVNKAIKDTAEWKEAEDKKAEFEAAHKARIEADHSVMRRINEKLKADKNLTRDNALETMDITKERHEYDVAIQIQKDVQIVMPSIAATLEAKIASLRVEKAVYFEPRAGEVVMAASEVDALRAKIEKRKAGTVITLEGKVVEDNRGKEFNHKVAGKWVRTKILKLGDKLPSRAVTEPTEAQALEIEADRVAVLTDSQKAIEKEAVMADAINIAADMRSELEIKSDPNALTKSQTWYQTEVARIEGLYG